ncbi:hypothetical protein [Pectobacterium versatile]|jgi:hypothetical protein|nr:hypothetical protein [Pectobacterium versatile]
MGDKKAAPVSQSEITKALGASFGTIKSWELIPEYDTIKIML